MTPQANFGISTRRGGGRFCICVKLSSSVSVTVCTVVQNCCKGDEPCQWNTPILDPRGSKTADPIDIKFDRGDYVVDITHMQTLLFLSLRGGAVVHMREIVIIRVYYLHPATF